MREAHRSHRLICTLGPSSPYSKGRKELQIKAQFLLPGFGSLWLLALLWQLSDLLSSHPFLSVRNGLDLSRSAAWFCQLFSCPETSGAQRFRKFKFDLSLPVLVKVGKTPLYFLWFPCELNYTLFSLNKRQKRKLV